MRAFTTRCRGLHIFFAACILFPLRRSECLSAVVALPNACCRVQLDLTRGRLGLTRLSRKFLRKLRGAAERPKVARKLRWRLGGAWLPTLRLYVCARRVSRPLTGRLAITGYGESVRSAFARLGGVVLVSLRFRPAPCRSWFPEGGLLGDLRGEPCSS